MKPKTIRRRPGWPGKWTAVNAHGVRLFSDEPMRPDMTTGFWLSESGTDLLMGVGCTSAWSVKQWTDSLRRIVPARPRTTTRRKSRGR